MAIKLKSGNGPVLRALQRSDVGGTVSHDWVAVQTSGGTTTQDTQQDAVFDVYTSATYHREGTVFVEGLGDTEIQNPNPNIGTVASDGTITRLASGILRLRIKTPLITIPLELDLRDKTEEVDQPKTFVSTVSGSLAEHLQQQVDNRLAAIASTPTMADNGLVFTTQNHSTQTYVRNPDLWCSQGTPVDLTCISPWNFNGGHRKAGTLITPRHVINAAHYEYSVGNTVRFVAMDGTVHDRTVVGKKRHPDYSPYYPDLTIYTLGSDLPVAVTPCQLMPSDWNNYLVQNFYNRPPALGLDQEEKALIIDFNRDGSFFTPTNATRLIFHENKIPGDSGNPAFLIVNDELVLVTTWTRGGVGSGTPVADNISDLNQMIVDSDTQAGVSTVDDPTWPNAGGHYQVKEADFSGFPSWP